MSDIISNIDGRIHAANLDARRLQDEILRLKERLICTREVVGSLEDLRAAAQVIEAQRAETENTGSVADESAVPKGCAR